MSKLQIKSIRDLVKIRSFWTKKEYKDDFTILSSGNFNINLYLKVLEARGLV